MSKYAPLHDFLSRRSGTQVPMSFSEVERILGFPLPNSARNWPAWWSNNPGTHVGVKAWRDAGWKTSRVDLANEQVTFVREDAAASYVQADGAREAQGGGMSEAARPFDEIAISPATLSRSTLAMIDDLAEETGRDRGGAVAMILDACAAERRRQLLEALPVANMPHGHDSAVLVREDRDRS